MPTQSDTKKPDLSRIFRALVPKLVLPAALHTRAQEAALHVVVPTHEAQDLSSETTQPTPETSTPEASSPEPIDVDTLARGLGLRIDPHARRLVYRTELSHQLEEEPPSKGAPLDMEARAHWTSLLLAVRYILDQQLVEWKPALERPAPNVKPAYQKKDIPSSYGERLPMLVPSVTRQRVEEQIKSTQNKSLTYQKLTEDLDIIFSLEVGKYQHLMTEEDAALCQLSREQLIADARYMLFYQSYKIKPAREQMTFGKVRHYITREGLGATRAILLPDFDIEAAREQGFAMILSRDYLVTVEPTSPEHRDEARAWCEAQRDALRLDERYIYPSTLFELGLEHARAMPW